ncbi:hypothetical protein TNCV_89201 [Trichonephila clavipes]|nr:hypothetical protein TNCV_89201 [Trichonephila clavipes]
MRDEYFVYTYLHSKKPQGAKSGLLGIHWVDQCDVAPSNWRLKLLVSSWNCGINQRINISKKVAPVTVCCDK